MKRTVTAAALLLSSALVQANATYDYIGNPFNEFRDSALIPGAYTASMRVTGFVEFVNPLPANTSLTNLASQVLSLSFTDGRITWNRGLTDPPFADLFFGTDAFGGIDEWVVEVIGSQPLGGGGASLIAAIATQNVLPFVVGGTFDIGQICQQSGVLSCDPAVTDFGTFRNQAGVWTLRPTTVPEPSTVSLVAGMLAMMAVGRRAKFKRDLAAQQPVRRTGNSTA